MDNATIMDEKGELGKVLAEIRGRLIDLILRIDEIAEQATLTELRLEELELCFMEWGAD